MKIPLYKLFLIQAAYAIPLAAFCRLGSEGIMSSLVVGTGLSGLILLVRRDNIGSALNVGVGSIVGFFFGGGCLRETILTCLHPMGRPLHTLQDRGDFEEWAWCGFAGQAIGAIVGGLLVSFFLNRRPRTPFS